MKQVFLYGIGGADTQYGVIRYTCIPEEDISINTIKYEASMMRIKYPSVKRVFAIDNRPGLRRDYIVAIKKNSIESCAIFRDILEKEGNEIF